LGRPVKDRSHSSSFLPIIFSYLELQFWRLQKFISYHTITGLMAKNAPNACQLKEASGNS
jgi:hypothetical protein